MEKIIQKYDKKIALLEEKIQAQNIEIQKLEKKYSTQKMNAEKEREEALIQHNVSKDGNDNGMQSKRAL